MTAVEVRAPRLSANDDAVMVSRLLVRQGDKIEKDAILAEIEGDKTTFEIPAPGPGFILRVDATEGSPIEAGGIILWIGEHRDTPVPASKTEVARGGNKPPKITAKARALLTKHGIHESAFDGEEGPITADAVEILVAGLSKSAMPVEVSQADEPLPAEGTREPLHPAGKSDGQDRILAWARAGSRLCRGALRPYELAGFREGFLPSPQSFCRPGPSSACPSARELR